MIEAVFVWQKAFDGMADIMGQNTVVNLLMTGGAFLMGMYHLTVSWMHRKQRDLLYFGLLCFVVGVRIFITDATHPQQILLEIQHPVLTRLDYLTAAAVVWMLVWVVRATYPSISHRFAFVGSGVLAIVYMVFVFCTSVPTFTATMHGFQFGILLCMVYVLVTYIRAAVRRLAGANFHLLGATVFIFTVVNDVLYYNDLVSTGPLVPVGFFVFLFVQSIYLAQRFALALETSEVLSQELSLANETLELQVQQRTAQLQTALSTLTRTEQARRDLVDNLSHDIGTPLTSIRGYIQAILDGVIRTNTEVYLRRVYEKAELIGHLLEDLTTLSELELGHIPFQRQVVVLTPFLQQVYQHYQVEMQQKQITFLLQMGCEQKEHVLYVDPIRLQQVFMNLLSNALKFTPLGGTVRLTAAVRSDKPGSEVAVLTVEDNGFGIPKEDIPNVFRRHYRGQSCEPGIAGKGLGLFISREIVEALGGSISVTSEVGVGSSFLVELPAFRSWGPSS